MASDFSFWLAQNLDIADLETLRDEGAAAGIPGMVYYGETAELYQKFSHDVWNAVVDYCDNNGFKVNDIIGNIVTAECDSHRHFANNMIWFAAEYYVDEAIRLYSSDDEVAHIHLFDDDEEGEEDGVAYITLG